jgi:hypothetical protein
MAFTVASRITGTVSANPVIWYQLFSTGRTHEMRPDSFLNGSLVHPLSVLWQTIQEGHPRTSVRTRIQLDHWVKYEFAILFLGDEFS